jgi:hypothetical protein
LSPRSTGALCGWVCHRALALRDARGISRKGRKERKEHVPRFALLAVFARILLALVLVLAAGPAAAEPEAVVEPPPAQYVFSASGHPYRVTFDPASRVWLGLAGAVDHRFVGPPVGAFEVDAGVSYRTRRSRGEGQEQVLWQIDHRFVAGWVQPAVRMGGIPVFDAALYSISMLRHDATSAMMLPTSPPVGIPFHFDVGIEAEGGRVTTLAYPTGASTLRAGVVNSTLFLDPWRSGAPGRSFEIGLGARYDIDVVTSPVTGPSPVVIHRVAPLTAGMIRFRFQSRDGLTVVDVRGDAVPHYTSEGMWRFLALSSAHLGRTLFAISDQPIVAVLEGNYRLDPPRRDVAAVSDLRVSLGLRMNLDLQ